MNVDDHETAGGFKVSFAAGSRIAGYRLEDQIGHGGMAVVFRARDEQLGRLVALKILAPALAGDAEFQRRFTRESQAAAAIDDPHIVPVFAAGEADGMLFIAMRYVAGGDARSLLNREGPLPPNRVAAIISPVASALDAAHHADLVHRDVKPSNMLMDVLPGRPDHVYLSDFGLSKAVASTSGMTRAGLVLGTLDYMSPEQIAGKPVDGRADQYALACSAYELLAGAPPFRRDEPTAMMYAHLSESPPQLTSRRPDLPRAVDGVLSRALAKAPGDRYASCGQFADALRGAFGFQPYDSGPRVIQAAAHPPTETAWPAGQPATASIDPAVGAWVAPEDVRVPGYPVRSDEQTPATPADGHGASPGSGAPAGGLPQGPGRPAGSGTGPGLTSPPPRRRNRSPVMAAIAAAAVVALYFAVAAVAHTPPFTESTHSISLTGAGMGAGTLNLTTRAESDRFTGNISPLGSVTGYDNLTFTFTGGGRFRYTGTRTIVTANGDKLFSALQGSGTSPTSTTSTSANTDTFTGGTGRFTGATGAGTGTASTVFSVTGTTQTFHYIWTTRGNIRY